ncbi:sigma-54-dependent Fis family transcriptional regulator [Alkalicoccus luteus]|uniref:Sigma-54-dependent Fis family transcriptional regulator n=1 Tax=Alkalicoccus luteus TaxID=1237094 RepID=A0A969PQA5_9BACI|nr:sigma-54-dependent Fis family transcriptional regulator [Alkalicoccus luteus]NJP38397.1 sigma-54-dependent Fis family transcriptional regulator [Alkalicoccus luteus]
MELSLIGASRKRCEGYGILPDSPVEPKRVNAGKLRMMLKQDEVLLNHMKQLFRQLEHAFESKAYTAVFVNREGYVLTRCGSLGAAEKDRFMEVGTNWSESAMGTNAMGIVLFDRRPAVIHGEHHYYKEHHSLTCAASPLYDADQRFRGAVNISTAKENYHPMLLSLTETIAEAAAAAMKLDRSREEELMLEEELAVTSRLAGIPMITVKKGKVVRANGLARSKLGSQIVGQEITRTPTGRSTPVGNDTTVVALREAAAHPLHQFDDIAGSCPSIVQLKELGKKAADSDYPVIIYGESGTGKELMAQSMHTEGCRSTGPFVALNCSAIPETLIESELFGYEKGAFTGASHRGQAGKFESADKGTIFLDEVGDLSLKAQGSLLRVLQERAVTRIGSVTQVPIDVRVLSATNKNLKQEVREGRFREDLYYRLKGIHLTMPPLRERQDVLEVAEVLLEQLAAGSTLSDGARRKLERYAWPGNIRELQSVLMQGVFLAGQNSIEEKHIQFEDEYERSDGQLSGTLEDIETEAVARALKDSDGNVSKAAESLGLARNTMYAKIKKYDISINET